MTPQESTKILKDTPIEDFGQCYYFYNDRCCPIGVLLKVSGINSSDQLLKQIGLANDEHILNGSFASQIRIEQLTGLTKYELARLQDRNDKGERWYLQDLINKLYDKYHPCIGI